MDISIFNLNCWLLPWPFSVDRKSRRARIADLILERNPDIITLQEVWSNNDLKYFQERLPAYHCASSETRLYNQTGLVTFVKEKPAAMRVSYFELTFLHNATEWLARKGYLETDITMHGKTWTIVNTHLYAALFKDAKRIVLKQLSELLASLSAPHMLLCGDLNLNVEQFENINQGRLSRLCDLQNTIDMRNPYTHKMGNRLFTGTHSKKYDYLLTNTSWHPSEYEVIRTPLLSDHNPQYLRASIAEDVPAGTEHNFINTGDDELKLYTIYAPPHHKDGIVHETKEDAEKDEESHKDEFLGDTTE